MKKVIFATIAMTLLAATIMVTSYGQSASAQLPSKDEGASVFAPGQLAEGPHCIGCGAKDFAPGQGPHCIGCGAKDIAPGPVAIGLGIIGHIDTK